jgi:acetyl esterase
MGQLQSSKVRAQHVQFALDCRCFQLLVFWAPFLPNQYRGMTALPQDRYAFLEEPGIRRFVIQSEDLYPADAINFTMEEQRAFYDRLCSHFRKPRPLGVEVEDRAVPGPAGPVPIRIYRRSEEYDGASLLYLHGGGFVLGGLESHDDVCAELCDRAHITVVAVEYRLAPEHCFPAAFEDCLSAFNAISDRQMGLGLDPSRILVGGDSAGGNLAAALCLKLRDDGRPTPRGQILIYPGLGGDRSKGSYLQHANAPGLTTADTEYYKLVYVGPPDHPHHKSKFAYPLEETDYRGLPPAYLVAAEWDPLRDDCFDYAHRLQAAGILTHVRHEPLLVHAFLRARNISPAAAASFTAVVEAVKVLAETGTLPSD